MSVFKFDKVTATFYLTADFLQKNSWVSRDVTRFAQISARHVGVPRVSSLC